MLFGQCPHGGVNKLKGASLNVKEDISYVTLLLPGHQGCTLYIKLFENLINRAVLLQVFNHHLMSSRVEKVKKDFLPRSQVR